MKTPQNRATDIHHPDYMQQHVAIKNNYYRLKPSISASRFPKHAYSSFYRILYYDFSC